MESIQVLINTINNAPNFEALKGQLVVALTQIYENGGGGGGVQSVTGIGNSVDETDPLNPVVKPLCNPDANAAPTVDDDSSQGYAVGSTWFDTTTGTLYVCSDSTNGAAVWVGALPLTGTNNIANFATFSSGDPASIQAVLVFGEDFTMKSIDNGTGFYSQVFCSPSGFELTSFDGTDTARFASGSSGQTSLGVNSLFYIKTAFVGGETQIAFLGNTPVGKQPAIPNATNSTDVVTRFNELLAAMRLFGFISE